MARNISQKEYDKRAKALMDKLRREVVPFKERGKAAKQKRKRKAGKDFLYFCKTYLPHHFDDPFEDGHIEMAESLSSWNKIIHWRGFRGTGKTTLGVTGYAVYAALFKKTQYLPILSDTAGQAELLMLPLRVEMEGNERIAHDFGPQKGMVWSNDELVTRGNVKVEAFSYRSFKRGRKHMQWRPTLVIADDWENLESVRNPANTDHREDALLGDVFPALDLKKAWQILIITNKLGRNDLGDRLEDNEQVKNVILPARKGHRLEGKPTHPLSFPEKVLKNILKSIGIVRFSREYLLKIVSSEHDDFQEQWLTWVKKPEDKRKLRVMALDPSVGSTAGHDTKAIVCMDLTEDMQHFDVVDCWIRHDTISNMCRKLFAMNQKWDPHEVVIETNGFQELIGEKLKNMALGQPERIDLLTKLCRLVNRTHKNTRIMRLQTPIQNGAIRFVEDAGDVQTLINQLLDFSSDRTDNSDDGPDALEMARRRLRAKAGMSANEVQCELI